MGVGSKGESAGTDGADVLDYFYNPADGDFVIDADVLWSCTSCGACVQQCPVDIEHVDHIMDMRRHQLLVESNFPAELNQLFKGLENKGNPWNMSSSARMDWAKGLEFDVPVVGEDLESLESVDWLFWVGCAGAYEDRAKKTTRAVAELLDMAGISFGVLGNGETCTGDPARRAGNEFVFQGLAQQNVETFQEYKVKKVVSTCAHCFNTLKNEYKDFGIELEVVHHTQLLNRLVREGKLTPVKDGAGAAKRSITYHDPCYLGRHNQVYEPPRELLQVLPGAEFVEMERNSERSFCCGAGGARMWMEENIGERINVNRTREAVGTGADQIAVGCPFCRVMLSDGLTAQQAAGEAREEVEVLDVAQMLLASVKGEQATKAAPGSSAAPAAAPATAAAATTDVATKDEPEAGDVTVTEETVTETADAGPAAKASGGSSLFDTPAPEETKPTEAKPAESRVALRHPRTRGDQACGGQACREHRRLALRHPRTRGGQAHRGQARRERRGLALRRGACGAGRAGSRAPEGRAQARRRPRFRWLALRRRARRRRPSRRPRAPDEAEPKPAADLGSGGSLFDVEPSQPAEPEAAEPETRPTEKAEPKPVADLGSGGSLFDVEPSQPAEPEAAEPETAEAAPEPEPEPEPAKKATPAPAAGLGTGGSLFDIASPEPTPAPAAEADAEAESDVEDPDTILDSDDEPEPSEAEPEPEAPAAPASSGTTSAPSTDVDLSSLGSLFDVEAPATAAAPTATTSDDAATPATDSSHVTVEPETADVEAEATDTAEAEPTAEEPAPASAPPSGADLSQAAIFTDHDDAASSTEEPADEAEDNETTDSETVPDADADADDAAEAEAPANDEEPEEKPAPADETPGHAPRTDVDISGSGSLFDL